LRRTTPSAKHSKHSKPSKHAKTKAKAKAPAHVSRARAANPARSTVHAVGRSASKAHLPLVPRRAPVPSPMPIRHVAPPRPAVMAPARSMPPAKDLRRVLAPMPAPRPPVLLPDFGESGVMLAITYSIREGRRNEFFDLLRELKPLLGSIGGSDCTVFEDRSRPNYLMEVFRFKDEAEFTAFDDKFHKDRKIAAIYALLDDIVEAEKSDFKIFERRL
jgi:hypothetical protein